MVTVMKNFQ